jgi:hypothetical protein
MRCCVDKMSWRRKNDLKKFVRLFANDHPDVQNDWNSLRTNSRTSLSLSLSLSFSLSLPLSFILSLSLSLSLFHSLSLFMFNDYHPWQPTSFLSSPLPPLFPPPPLSTIHSKIPSSVLGGKTLFPFCWGGGGGRKEGGTVISC